jgi:hypothetical protein
MILGRKKKRKRKQQPAEAGASSVVSVVELSKFMDCSTVWAVTFSYLRAETLHLMLMDPSFEAIVHLSETWSDRKLVLPGSFSSDDWLCLARAACPRELVLPMSLSQPANFLTQTSIVASGFGTRLETIMVDDSSASRSLHPVDPDTFCPRLKHIVSARGLGFFTQPPSRPLESITVLSGNVSSILDFCEGLHDPLPRKMNLNIDGRWTAQHRERFQELTRRRDKTLIDI